MEALLLLGLASAVAHAFAQYQQPCRETKYSPDSGLLRVPDFGEPPHFNVTCVWSYPVRDGKKLLIRVDSVHLPPDELRESSLKIVLDDEIVDIPRNCVRCLKMNFVTTGSAKVLYRSVLLEEFSVDESPSELATTEVGAFQIRYKAFDPDRCDSPWQPLNGFAYVSSRKIGQEVVYGCKPPYDLSGPERAVCIVKDDLESPVPEWTAKPQKCVMTNCSATVHRTVGSGAVASPGYPLYMIPSPVDCRWVLQAENGGRIQVNITYLKLADKTGSFGTLNLHDQSGELLSSYSYTREKAMTFVSNSSELVVSLTTNNTEAVTGGFYMDYQLLRTNCPEPDRPDYGQVIFTSLAVGSVANYRCSSGYIMQGGDERVCLSNTMWNGTLPKCVPHLDLHVQDFPVEQSSVPSNSSPSPTVPTSSLDSISLVISSTEQVKVTKPSRKSKLKPTEKTLEKATKSKPLESSKMFENNSSEISSSREEDMDDVSKTDKSDVNPLQSINSAQEKHSKTKNKDNSTLVKQKQFPESVVGVVETSHEIAGPFPVPHLDEDDLDKAKDQDGNQDEEVLGLKSYIIIGVASVLLFIVLCLVTAMVIYRRRFPVRLGFGRKFSTFENPVYVSKDAQHTRELKRLTI